MNHAQRDPLRVGYFGRSAYNALCLTDGYFWTRRQGGYNVYRGVNSPHHIAYGRPVAARTADATQLTLPAALVADADTVHCFAVRTVGPFGHESSDAAIVSFRTDADCDGTSLPNAPYGLEVRTLGDRRVGLRWRYDSTGQSAWPTHFAVYSDNGTGTIDYDTPADMVTCESIRRRYAWQSDSLAAGYMYRFVVRAVTADGATDGNRRSISIAVHTTPVVAPDDITAGNV